MAEDLRCRWCGRRFPVARGPGRPREFCRRSCRQRDYEARRRASELGLSESELVMTRAELDELGDLLFVLEAAIEDVSRDLAGNPTKSDYAEAVDWLLAAARPVVGRGIHGAH
ncbi:MAG TPA: hypothetical protein VMW08_05105 [Acidimicrobiales bacterium]|nr:hypothetical protein [Acidimicrobiales bacterium]